jgi:hypothetical protein
MLPAIDLDDEPPFKADKIQNVGPERHLSTKLDATEAAVAKQEPKFPLCTRRDASHCARVPALQRFDDLVVRRL